MFKRWSVIVVCLAAIMALPAAASAKDYAETALNIIPSGQLQPGEPPAPMPNDAQATMYDGLTPLFDDVSDGDLTTYFKSEALNSLGTDGPGTTETIPGHPGITDHPRHLRRPSRRRRDLRRRHLRRRLDRRRGPRPAAPAGALQRPRRRDRRPGAQRDRSRHPAEELRPQPADRGRRRQADAGAQGRRARRARRSSPTSTPTSTGSTHWYELHSPATGAVHPQRHLRAERAQGPVPRRGRRRRGAAHPVPRRPAGPARREAGHGASSTTCASSRTRASRRRSTASSSTGRSRSKPNRATSIIDHDSYQTTPAVADRALAAQVAPQPVQASNTLMITKEHSNTGNAADGRRPADRLLLPRASPTRST